jgi:hypothetical protein
MTLGSQLTQSPPQLVDSLSIYNPVAASPSPNDVTKPAPTANPTLPSIPPAECAMDTIEAYRLSCPVLAQSNYRLKMKYA